MAKEVLFLVEDAVEGGYIARALGHSIFTEADSWEELKEAIRDAVHCHFEPDPLACRARGGRGRLRLPRDLSGEELAVLLGRYGYEVTRQTGSHIRLTTTQGGEHHITIPCHESLRVGTLNAILRDVAEHLDIPRQTLLTTLFGR
jgi:predicted RNA binding protein YcfA (HicA-like mRNA interferase family)